MKYGFELEEEVERLHELEVIPRIKCMQCHAYMPSGTKSFFCLKCSKKRMFTAFPSLISGFALPSLSKNAK